MPNQIVSATLVRRLPRIAGVLFLLGAAMVQRPSSAAHAAPPSATFIVDTIADTNDASPGNGVCVDSGGNCSLRAAITEANALAGDDTIILPALTAPAAYRLTITNVGGENEDANATGDLDINQSLTIQGGGAASTIIEAGTNVDDGIDKVFGVNPFCANGINVTIDGVTVRYGRNTQVPPRDDFAYTGGGIDWCGGTGTESFTLSNSVVTDNTNVYGYGGGLNVDSYSGYTGSVTIANTIFSNNRTLSETNTATGAGVNIYGHAPTTTITDSQFLNNSTAATGTNSGGGLFFRPGYGGSLSIADTTFDGNSASADGYGGGLFLEITQLTGAAEIVDTEITGNSAKTGGGMYIGSAVAKTIAIRTSTFTGNTAAEKGGGLYTAGPDLTLEYSRITGNAAAEGGGLYTNTSTGAVTAVRNWWGCGDGPGAAGCDTAVNVYGTLTADPWLTVRMSIDPDPVALRTNQTAVVTASYAYDSDGASVDAENLTALVGLPVDWSATFGTLDNAQSLIDEFGQAANMYRAAGTDLAVISAQLDSDSSAASQLSRDVTVTKANTTATILSDLPDPTGQDETFTITFSVTGEFGNTPVAPTGQVMIYSDYESCFVTLPVTSCEIYGHIPGPRQFRAVYEGDGNFNGSTSDLVDHAVNKEPSFTSMNWAYFSEGAAGSFTVTTSGYPYPTIVETGALPSGVTFTDNGDGTATIAGTPEVGTGGIYNFTITAANGLLPDATQNFSLEVWQAPVITSPDNVTFTAGTAGSFTVMTDGLPIPAITRGGDALPSGMTFADNGDGTATLSGTPAAGTDGVYNLTFTAANTVLPDAVQDFTLTVEEQAAPGAFSKSSPADGAYQPSDPRLEWGVSVGADEYEYCIDQTDNDTCDASWISTGTSAYVDLSGLGQNDTYYWQVRAINGTGTTDADGGTWWGFTSRWSTFADVPEDHPFWAYIEAFHNAGITGGCGFDPMIFCPDLATTRAAMAVFLLRAKYGASYTPPAASHYFADMPVAGKEWMEPWVDQLYREGITGGCGVSPLRYCPENPVTRAAMAVFILRAVHGASYTPPAASHYFADMPVAGKEWMEPWVDQAYREGITSGCDTGPLVFCPENTVWRKTMAVFIVRAFGLPLP